jgi:ATP-dependent exoDNAse (exonuclease V) alpha subunit
MQPQKIELNAQFQKALDVMEHTRKNVFITGKAGTGKSTLLDYFRSTTNKRIVVLAPTGVAALNVRGETIHSFFGFKPDITLKKIKKLSAGKTRIYKELEAIVIDEISMVRADLLDCIDRFLQLNAAYPESPFGGIQMICIGDLYQLPPVVTAKEKEIFGAHYKSQYFFDADSFKGFPMEFIELEKIYRQKDALFIKLLNTIRNNSLTEADLRMLNTRVGADLTAGGASGYVVHVTTTNQSAGEINSECLHKLHTKNYVYHAEIEGDFKEHASPTDPQLCLCIGAQVMLLNNDSQGRWVNGSIGEVITIKNDKETNLDSVFVRVSDGLIVEVLPFTWEIFHFSFDKNTGTIETDFVGSFTQYPLKLAWAITIHKSQGKTFDRVIIDMGKGAFAGGQTYVALSRCTSLEGITLTRPIKRSDIFMDWRIVRFVTGHQYALSARDMPLEDKMHVIRRAIQEEKSLEIVYLKARDEKSRRVIKPFNLGEKIYRDKPFIGVDAYCLERRENRVFRVDRILEIKAGSDTRVLSQK